MSKYFTIIVLPLSVDITSNADVEQTADRLMQPYKFWEADEPAPPGHRPQWDYYWCCPKDWMVESGRAAEVYEGQEDLVFPVDKIGSDAITYALLTPDGVWHEPTGPAEVGDAWGQCAIAILQTYRAHFGVLAYCHG